VRSKRRRAERARPAIRNPIARSNATLDGNRAYDSTREGPVMHMRAILDGRDHFERD
jgi:hypothetical protein